MFETLVWATDGSATANRALTYVKQLAAPGAQIYVVHVREIFVGRGAGYPVFADEPELQDAIAEQVEDLRAEGFDAHFRVLTAPSGHVSLTIADVARDVEAEIILAGTHGYGRIAGLFLGSTTQGLLHADVCPVLAVPAGSDRELAATS
jgi:nucleotide-binding universal stress UspA family protein